MLINHKLQTMPFAIKWCAFWKSLTALWRLILSFYISTLSWLSWCMISMQFWTFLLHLLCKAIHILSLHSWTLVSKAALTNLLFNLLMLTFHKINNWKYERRIFVLLNGVSLWAQERKMISTLNSMHCIACTNFSSLTLFCYFQKFAFTVIEEEER